MITVVCAGHCAWLRTRPYCIRHHQLPATIHIPSENRTDVVARTEVLYNSRMHICNNADRQPHVHARADVHHNCHTHYGLLELSADQQVYYWSNKSPVIYQGGLCGSYVGVPQRHSVVAKACFEEWCCGAASLPASLACYEVAACKYSSERCECDINARRARCFVANISAGSALCVCDKCVCLPQTV